MKNRLVLYNTLSRKKEQFEPINPPFVGLYVCGPTVYGDAHLGHARPAITFDLLFRYLKYLGYKVRYVRNITDVGHLTDDSDDGEDKIEKKAKLDRLEPMEIVQFYTNRYHHNMEQLNTLPPSIEPHASGHIIEQEELVKKILANGFAYESDGSIYFDVEAYNKKYSYGKLSGRRVEELFANTRQLDGQGEKRNPADFALWKKATPEHIMRWPSPWSNGFPGWHLECSCMSQRTRSREILDAQQYGHYQGTENGQIAGEFHHPGPTLFGRKRCARASLFPDDRPFLYPAGPLPESAGFLERGPESRPKGI